MLHLEPKSATRSNLATINCKETNNTTPLVWLFLWCLGVMAGHRGTSSSPNDQMHNADSIYINTGLLSQDSMRLKTKQKKPAGHLKVTTALSPLESCPGGLPLRPLHHVSIPFLNENTTRELPVGCQNPETHKWHQYQ